jgi:uncharacterized membrane protein YraQ (UPF0718 family)
MIAEFITNLFSLANAMAIYILLGLLAASILKQIIPDDFVIKHLGTNSTLSVIKATLFGIPLPVCSCSVIPLADSLRKEGASKGAVQSFLISTPITGIDSITATYGFFGWVFTIYRIVSSIILAIVAGLVQNVVDAKPAEELENEACCATETCCKKDTKKKGFSIKEVFYYAYVELFGDMAKALFFGLIIGASFTTFMPKELTAYVFENQFLTYGLILLIALPLYVCATASLPMAAALMADGMSAGAGFIFLSAGPATNSVTMGVVYNSLGKSALVVYLGVISSMSLLFAYLFDTFFSDVKVLNFATHAEHTSILNIFATIIMFTLIAYFMLKPLTRKIWK